MLCSEIGGRPPRLVPWRCTHGSGSPPDIVDCEGWCGISKCLNVADCCPIFSECNIPIRVFEWKLAPRAGTNKKGEQNTQIELTESSDPLRTVVDRFEKQLELCRKHYNAMQWLRLARQTDIRTFTADELLIFTDFASTVDLKAACTDNSSQDAHAVLWLTRASLDMRPTTRQNTVN